MHVHIKFHNCLPHRFLIKAFFIINVLESMLNNENEMATAIPH